MVNYYRNRLLSAIETNDKIIINLGGLVSHKTQYDLQYQRIRILEGLKQFDDFGRDKFLPDINQDCNEVIAFNAYHNYVTRNHKDYYDYPFSERMQAWVDNMKLRWILNSDFSEVSKIWFSMQADKDKQFPRLRQTNYFKYNPMKGKI